jgi:hypothetical protein
LLEIHCEFNGRILHRCIRLTLRDSLILGTKESEFFFYSTYKYNTYFSIYKLVNYRDIDNRDRLLPSQLKYHACLLNLKLVASKTY